MADLQFVDFASVPGSERKETQLSLPDNFSELNFTILSWTSHSASRFPALFRGFYNTDRSLFGDPQDCLHEQDKKF